MKLFFEIRFSAHVETGHAKQFLCDWKQASEIRLIGRYERDEITCEERILQLQIVNPHGNSRLN